MSTLTSTPSSAADWRSATARIGLIGRALLYLVFGLLAIDIARGGSGESSTQGAIERIAGDGFGRLLLIALCAGLAALVVWKALQAIAGDPVEGSEATDRVEFAIKAVVYGAALLAAISVLAANWDGGGDSAGGSGSGSGGSKQEATAALLEWPAGQFLVIALGLGIVAFGVYEIWAHGIDEQFMDRLDTGAMPEGARHTIEVTGRVGYTVKGATTILVGGFLVTAGWQHDPNETTGISGALSELGDSTWGAPLLWVAGVGLIGYAAFSLVEAKYRRAS